MISDRPYRKGMSLDEAIEEIKKGTGSQFDPLMANVFVKMVERKYRI
jgi:HD-GYP domain-containing protein (c-di-GMP phosphodiesterase class II)